MPVRRVVSAILSVAFVVCIGLWWWLERGDSNPAPAPRREEAAQVPRAELAGRAAGETTPAPLPATTAPARVPTWRLEGRVTSKGSAGVAGAIVDVTLWRGEIQTLVGSATADRDGAYALDLAPAHALGAFALGGAALRVLAHADGFAPAEAHESNAWPKDVTEDLVLRKDIDLPEGDVLRGRVVRPDGTPVARAEVGFCDGVKAAPFAATLPDGRYRIAHPGRAEGFVVAFAQDIGTGRIPTSGERLLPDLVLYPAPSVEGTVVYADGSPVGDITLWADVTGSRDPCLSGAWWQGNTRSRADGTFRIFLPASGPCALHTHATRQVDCSAGDHDVRIVVRAHRLRVHVVDGEDRPLPGLGISGKGWDAEHAGLLDELLAGRGDPDEVRGNADYSGAHTVSGPDATTDFFGLPGSVWLFAGDAPGSLPAEVVARVPAEGNETDVRLVIRPRVGGGRLRVRALDPDGKPVPLLRVEIDTALGSYLFEGPVAWDAEPLGPFPGGKVHLSGQSIRDANDSGWAPPADAWLLEAAVTATVRDAADTDVSLRPAWGGRLKITLRGAEGAAAKTSYGVRAVPIDGGAPQVLMGRASAPAENEEPGSFSTRWSAGGPTYVATLLPAEPIRLEVIASGTGWAKPVGQALVTVRAREVTDVTIDLRDTR